VRSSADWRGAAGVRFGGQEGDRQPSVADEFEYFAAMFGNRRNPAIESRIRRLTD
jgi:hypothetical protein